MTTFDVDAERDIIEIRRLKAKGYSDEQVIQFMQKAGDNMSRATFYRRKQQMREQMFDAIKEMDKATVMEDINLCRVRLEDCIKRIEDELDRDRGEDNLSVNEVEKLVARKEELSMHMAMLQHDAVKVLSSVNSYGESAPINTRDTAQPEPEQQEPAAEATTQEHQ